MVTKDWIERCSACNFMFEDGYGQWKCLLRDTFCKYIFTCPEYNPCENCTWCFETVTGEMACALTLDDLGFSLCEFISECPKERA